MPSLSFAFSVEQLETATQVARDLRTAFESDTAALAAVALILNEVPLGVRGLKPPVEPKRVPVRVADPATFWTKQDGFLWTEAPPPPTHFVGMGWTEIIACLGLKNFPDKITHSDQWTPQAVLRAFQLIHGDVWDDIVKITVEPPSRTCFCARTVS